MQNKKRVFIGIKALPQIAELSKRLQENFPELPARLIHPEDIHLTLIPPWTVRKEEQPEVETKIQRVLKDLQPFEIKFQNVCFGPTSENPRFIWIKTDCPPALKKLKKNLDAIFGIQEIRPFLPHLTLARLNEKDQKKWCKVEVEKKLDVKMEVRSIELFESKSQEKIKYSVLKSLKLK